MFELFLSRENEILMSQQILEENIIFKYFKVQISLTVSPFLAILLGLPFPLMCQIVLKKGISGGEIK